MWIRRELKAHARTAVKNNYWFTVAVCFIIAIVVGKYGFSTIGLHQYSEVNAVQDKYVVEKGVTQNTEIVNYFLNSISDGEVNILLEKNPKASKGVLATVFNNSYQSRSFLYGILNSVNQLFFADRVGAGIIILIGVIFSLLFFIFITNILKVCECRFFIENRLYPKTGIRRILFLYRLGRVWNPAKVMAVRSLFLSLWCLTIVGGPIKYYSYRMVPYILAENPDIPYGEALELSMNMMRGNKWRAFVLDISFWYWYLLQYFTLGLVGIFYANSYVAATNAELYMALRGEALVGAYRYSENLKDHYLTLAPASNSLAADWAVDQYPEPLYFIIPPKGRTFSAPDYTQKYGIRSLILMFFIFSFVGWCWEVGIHFFRDGIFVNRGFFLGPYLPIYGAGAVLMLTLLRRVANNPVLTFGLIMLICAVVEYITGYGLEAIYGVKWWDYSGYLLNLNGRICLEGTVFFGIGGCLTIYVLAPLVQELLKKVDPKVQTVFCAILVAVFILDASHSLFYPNNGEGITEGQCQFPKERL